MTLHTDTSMTASERLASISLAGLFSLRMLGLFMIYPVFSVYAQQLKGATPATIGLALGIYGLAQGILQIPFGILSDYWGRKPIIACGLVLFALGSMLAAVSTSIQGVILGRLLQGCGAVGSAILALAADLTREEHRTKAMAIIGMVIGLSFGVAVVLGPVLNSWVGVSGIFWFTSLLAILGLGVLLWLVPRPRIQQHHRDTQPVPAMFGRILRDGQLLRLNFSVFALHAVLTATFIALPMALHDTAGLAASQQWYLYLPSLIASVFIMVPFIILAEKRQRMRQVLLGAIVVIALSELLMLESARHLVMLALALIAFFSAFNLMEATLPSLVSKLAPADGKGTAMGLFSSSQFLGIFFGGLGGGWAYGHYGIAGIFVMLSLLCLLWLIVAWNTQPRYLSSRLLHVGRLDAVRATQLQLQLRQIGGVEEAIVIPDENTAYLKVDLQRLDEASLQQLLESTAAPQTAAMQSISLST